MAVYIKGDPVANATSYKLSEKKGSNYTQLAEASEINFEVSALGLAAGEHTLVVRASASGYADSDYSNEVIYIADKVVTTVSLAEFIDLVGSSSGSVNVNTSTGTPSINSSANWRYVKVSLQDYNIQKLCTVTGRSSNGVAPIIFLSSSAVTKDTIVSVKYGTSHSYLTNTNMYLFNETITIPEGATHMLFSVLMDYTVASSSNATELEAMCQVTYE